MLCALVMLFAIALPASGSLHRSELPETVQQGSLVVGHTQPRNTVELAGRQMRVGKDGAFVFGVGRDETGPLRLAITWLDGVRESINIAVTPREWPIERITGVPPATINPPPEIAASIEREQAQVAAARASTPRIIRSGVLGARGEADKRCRTGGARKETSSG